MLWLEYVKNEIHMLIYSKLNGHKLVAHIWDSQSFPPICKQVDYGILGKEMKKKGGN